MSGTLLAGVSGVNMAHPMFGPAGAAAGAGPAPNPPPNAPPKGDDVKGAGGGAAAADGR